ncbi:MAG: type II asparaginase [Desulfobacteraceae bacterium]|nr:type II asparaginase [Desulfobacteraceae bacterium]
MILSGLFVLVLAGSAHALPRIQLLATGGTIAGAQADTKQSGYKAGSFSIEYLINAVPQLKTIAELSGEQIVNIGSQDMSDAVWLKLAGRVNQLLGQPDVDGVVITHGTDTMEETAYFLNLVVKSDKPVVMVGSMRPATAISADGPMNLYNGVAVAAHPDARGRGVLVVLNDEIHYAREVQKQNSTQLDTFKSLNRGRAGVVNTGAPVFFSKPVPRHTASSEFSVEGVAALPRVEIFYAHANMGGEFIDSAVKSGVKGIVLAGVGDGNATTPALEALSKAAKAGVAVVRSTRTGSGVVARNVEVNDDRMGFVASMELNPQKARVLLMLGLMKTGDPKQLQGFFVEY